MLSTKFDIVSRFVSGDSDLNKIYPQGFMSPNSSVIAGYMDKTTTGTEREDSLAHESPHTTELLTTQDEAEETRPAFEFRMSDT